MTWREEERDNALSDPKDADVLAQEHVEADLAFDEATHTYTWRGTPVPSVTTILRAVGLIDFSRVPTATLDAAMQRGRCVHEAIDADMRGDLWPSDVSEDEAGRIHAARAWLKDSGFQPTIAEARLYHPTYQYAGTCDLAGFLHGTPTVVDWKTGRASDAVADLQLAAYAACLRETPPIEWLDVSPTTPIQRISVELTKLGRYRAEVYRGVTDFQKFLQCISIYREQIKRGVRAA